MKKILLLIFIFWFQACTFGSEGNSLTEKKIIITRLALLRDSIKINFNFQILFYDDQGDDNLTSFRLTSAVNTDIYTVTLNEGSKINFDKVEFYISTTNASKLEDAEQNESKIFLHETDSGTSGSSSAITKIYSTANGYSTSSFFKANGVDELGHYSASGIFVLASIPQGILKEVRLHIKSVSLIGSLKGSSKTKNFTIQMPLNDISFTRLCSTFLSLNQPLNLNLDIQYSNLFRDTSTSSTIDNTKILRAIYDLTDDNPVISDTQNSGIYAEIIKNWNLNSTLKEHRCNK
jgi:hypothetical protein